MVDVNVFVVVTAFEAGTAVSVLWYVCRDSFGCGLICDWCQGGVEFGRDTMVWRLEWGNRSAGERRFRFRRSGM